MRMDTFRGLGLFMQSLYFIYVRRLHEALAPTEEVVKLYRHMAKTNPAYQVDLAASLGNLGNLYSQLGRLQEALSPTEESVKIHRELAKTNPTHKSDLASSLGNLGILYSELGRIQEALAPTEEAVKIHSELAKINPAHQGDLAVSLDILGNIYSEVGRIQEALASTKEAVKIQRKLVKTNPTNFNVLKDLAYSQSNLGVRYRELGRIQEALAPTEDAVKIRRELAKTIPAYQGDLAASLANLGCSYSDLGRIQEALAPTQEAVTIYRQLAKTNPAYLDKLAQISANQANLQIALGNAPAAVPSYREAMASEAQFLQQQLPLMAETRRQAMVNILGSRWQQPFSLSHQGAAGAELALFTRLNRHAPLQDIERRQGIAARATGQARGVLDRLRALTARLSDPTLPIAQRQQAETESEKPHQELVRLLPALRPRLVEPDAVAERLPADGLLVEFQRYSPFDLRQPKAKLWGSPRYLALVLAPSGQIQAVDLGPAEALEQRIATALQHTRERQPEATASWGQVAGAVFGPLQGALAGRRRLLLAPDGELHRVPFSALALLAGDTRTLPSGVRLQTIGSGRDLVPVAGDKAPASGPLVLADPLSTGWPPLPAAAKEGAAVASSLGAPLIQGFAAKVSVLDQARGPRLIHVAGHGYFDAQASGDPLLASGLVLAGADRARLPSRAAVSEASGGAAKPKLTTTALDDGYLTAKEAARLQLDSTELVVLSACETGLGKQRTGEGVFGLQRALTVAGARGTLLSLWKVPDAASQTFMERFYALLKQGMAADQAVRQVQEEFRNQPKIGGQPKPGAWSDPYYWAAWQYTGVPDSPR